MMTRRRIGVLGAGSWGTALAKHLAEVGHDVSLWSRRAEQATLMRATRENKLYLPGAPLPDNLSCTSNLEEALFSAELVLSVVPAQTTREVWSEGKQFLDPGAVVLSASKGIETGTLALMSEVLENVIPDHPLGFIAGPSFAKEVAQHLPTAIVIASRDERVAKNAQEAFSSDWLRAYVTSDVCGAELGGALKNVIAIACGVADGLGFGHNTRAALITRGLAEISRMAVRKGADPLTLAGLAGMGDLVLTCTGDLSRNRRVGLRLGAGAPLERILAEMGQVAEGVATAKAARDLGEREGVEMPIAQEMYNILYDGKTPREVVISLMRRSLKREQD